MLLTKCTCCIIPFEPQVTHRCRSPVVIEGSPSDRLELTAKHDEAYEQLHQRQIFLASSLLHLELICSRFPSFLRRQMSKRRRPSAEECYIQKINNGKSSAANLFQRTCICTIDKSNSQPFQSHANAVDGKATYYSKSLELFAANNRVQS
ncbi:hypothetical protein AFLA_005512 [Aspergillus flavus NRRL3357]|nr:hypothetical protein AFLA_005512 [Aspergillus flavus NRRL3357]